MNAQLIEVPPRRSAERSAAYWPQYFDERAAIAERGGRMTKASAEARAFECCIVTWLNHNPVRSVAGICVACCGAERAHDCLLPFGTEPDGHVWLHSECWPEWHRDRRKQAVAALTSMGIVGVKGEGDNDR